MNRKRAATALLAFAGATVLAAVPARGDATVPDPRETVQRTSDELITVIEEAKGYYDEDPERFYTAVQQVLDPVIDFDAFARGVMAVYYKRASPEQRTRFAKSFKSGLVRTYAKALLEFSDQQIVVLPEDRPPRNPKKQMVKMEVRGSDGKVYPAVYAMQLYDDGAWRIRNITINGINIGLTYRNQFASAMKSPEYGGDLDRVIDGWAQEVAKANEAADEKDNTGT